MADDPYAPHPVPFVQAFNRRDRDALFSQAASLLLLGAQLDEEPVALEAVRAVEGDAEPGPMGFAPPEDVEPLQVPRVGPSVERFERGLLLDRATAMLPRSRGFVSEANQDALPALAMEVEIERSPESAATLFEACLFHPEALVRVAAAAAAVATVADPLPEMEVLAAEVGHRDPLVNELAATGLARLAPDHPTLERLYAPPELTDGTGPSHSSLLVHGTFARNSSWWQPGGDFHTYLKTEVRPDLFAGDGPFHWSGEYSAHGRATGAKDLHQWVQDQDLMGLDLFCHSHGGNVAMLASHQGLEIQQLVLLACPVHWREYAPDFGRVGRVLSIRVHLDLVVLLDRGGQRFRDSRIEEHVLPIWFDHVAPRTPEAWKRHDVPSWL